ncbi:ComEC/Rec2 family competence protein [Streptomyces flavofungini]|uniref:ComEC/Rec2 family competence protein n=1 Tax=Streptomyces flavofungini TaxID=68200 RepID=A0ABS0XB06_9ACTN|nr:ComEC/Rec2 family competence protein [Streptomyces flavofungini]MBJ3810400.1 ComEC/Rec2 family competence protein [Streptomyces flavofungini]
MRRRSPAPGPDPRPSGPDPRLEDPADPRQEGPADLRLVPPALAAWGAAALALDAPPRVVIGAVVVCVVVAGALLVVWTAWGCGGGRARAGSAQAQGQGGGGRAQAGRADIGGGHDRPRRGGRFTWGRVSVAAVLLCAAASATSAGLHGADLHRGPVPALAERYAEVTAEVEVTSDPRRTRPRVTGDRTAPPSIVLNAEVVRVREADGTTSVTRTPVLVIVREERTDTREAGETRQPRESSGKGPGRGPWRPEDARGPDGAVGRGGPVGAGGSPEDVGPEGTDVRPRGSPWLDLLPSTRLRARGSLAGPWSDSERIAAVLRVPEGQAPQVIGAPSATQRFAGELRAGLREATDGLPADARALLPGLVIGDTSRVPPDLDQAFRATDLTHLLAVSGGNLVIILALLIGPPGTAHRAERRGLAPRLGIPLRTTALLGGGLTLGFVIVCRPEPSVLRAAACGLIVLLAIGTGRRRSLLPALAAAVLVLVLYDPWLSRSYGFLLSVLATGALLTLAPRWSAAMRRRGVPGRLAEALAAAAAAQAVCAPVVAVLAARVSLVAVPCNLLAEFAVAPATVLGFAALALAPVAMPVAKVLAWSASWPVGWIASIARTGAALPGNGVDWPGSWSGALLLAIVTGALVLACRRLARHLWLSVGCVLLLLLVVVQPPPLTRVIVGWPPQGWRLVMCDVGQGDATVLAAGGGAGVVVDAGPDPVLVDRCLRSLGITRVPLVLLTHFHADHVAGLPGVLRGRSVGAIQTTGFQEPQGQAEFVRGQAAARGIPLTRAVAGERRRAGPLEWQVLWPPPGPGARPEGPNDASVTLLARVAGLTLLLLGDLEPPAQRALLRTSAGAALPRVDVLKVAHHGSAYQDPLLLRRAAPRLALVSCGEDNPYGHPSPRTVAALRAGGAQVLRTDTSGAIAVTGGRTGARAESPGRGSGAGGDEATELEVTTRR